MVSLPDPAIDDPLAATSSNASLVIAGGCFWGIEELYQHVRGVHRCGVRLFGRLGEERELLPWCPWAPSGHAESVKVTYDPSKITYGQLLKIFFAVAHDPTQKGGQGPDVGTAYRSVIFSPTNASRRSPPPTSPSSRLRAPSSGASPRRSCR